MIYQFYGVKDTLQNEGKGRFLNPALSGSEQEAIRQFKSNVNNIPLWRENPADFELWYLGSFDEETGELKGEMRKIGNGRSVLNVTETKT